MRILQRVLLCLTLTAYPCLLLSQQPSPRAPIPVAPARHSGTSLTIVVADENNVAVPDCFVTLTDTATGDVMRVQTDAAGRGRFLNLDPEHTFTIHAERNNFYPITKTDLRISGGQTL